MKVEERGYRSQAINCQAFYPSKPHMFITTSDEFPPKKVAISGKIQVEICMVYPDFAPKPAVLTNIASDASVVEQSCCF